MRGHLPAYRRPSLLLVGAAAVLSLSGCGEEQTEEDLGARTAELPAVAPAGDLDAGRDVFAANCAECHGANGEGAFGPRLAGGVVVERYPDVDDHRAVVVNGRGMMPAFGDRLSPVEIDAVVRYEREGL